MRRASYQVQLEGTKREFAKGFALAALLFVTAVGAWA